MSLKLKMFAAAAGLFSATGAMAATLGLDANCASNATDLGTTSWNGATYRRCQLPTDIVVAGTVTLPRTVGSTLIRWELPSVVVVGTGHQAGKTPSTTVPTVLQINSGAQVVGMIANSALVISRGARISANGSASQPVVFSSVDDNFTRSSETGEWGGVILSSWGNVNACNAAVGNECAMEGISDGQFYYGGYVNESLTPSYNDLSSGTLSYVVIAEGGNAVNVDIDGDPDDNSNSGDEINGLTLYGVNNETTLSNIHVHNNDDDGIEFFGGDVAVSRLWLTCSGDDSVDWDQGYNGSLTNVYILQEDGNDHAFELANNTLNYGATPVADAVVRNVTLAFADSSPAVDVPLRLKEGTGGSFSNLDIASAYTGNCFGSTTDTVNQNVLSAGDFSTIEYSCIDNANLLANSVAATGFSAAPFWAQYPGHCN